MLRAKLYQAYREEDVPARLLFGLSHAICLPTLPFCGEPFC